MSLRRKRKGRQSFMSLKLDMSKAYDRVECSYLRKVLETMGLKTNMIKLIMGCVSSTTFSILINGSPKGHLVPSRGLRQRDPLFPYLFLFCIEGLISLLSKASLECLIPGIQVCRGAPSIKYFFLQMILLFFARQMWIPPEYYNHYC